MYKSKMKKSGIKLQNCILQNVYAMSQKLQEKLSVIKEDLQDLHLRLPDLKILKIDQTTGVLYLT